VTSALLLVALLIFVELSYRRWVRHTIARRRNSRLAMNPTLDLEAREAQLIQMPARATSPQDSPHDARRSG
jgi:hypothetical protein